MSGGLACIAGVALLVWRVPELWRQDTRAAALAGADPRPGIAGAVHDAVVELTESEGG